MVNTRNSARKSQSNGSSDPTPGLPSDSDFDNIMGQCDPVWVAPLGFRWSFRCWVSWSQIVGFWENGNFLDRLQFKTVKIGHGYDTLLGLFRYSILTCPVTWLRALVLSCGFKPIATSTDTCWQLLSIQVGKQFHFQWMNALENSIRLLKPQGNYDARSRCLITMLNHDA